MGNRSREYVLDQFSTAYCTMVPSFFEAFGYVVIESFSIHTPVIGSDSTGISEIIRNNIDGLLFKAGRPCGTGREDYRIIGRQRSEGSQITATIDFLRKYELNNVVKDFAENNSIFK